MRPSGLKEKLKRYQAFLLDLDGVLVRGSAVIPGAPEALSQLKEMAPVVLLSNNSTRSRREFALLLHNLGFDVESEMIVNSAYVVAQYLWQRAGPSRVFVIGESGLREELELAGHSLSKPEEAEYLVVGLDREFNYEKLSQALRALLCGAGPIATNADPTFPAPEGLIPGAGAIVGAIRGMGFPPEIVGKPSPIIFQLAMEVAGVQDPKVCLVIGDRLDTDMLGAERAGMDSALILTGVTSRQDLEKSRIKPTFVVESLAALVRGDGIEQREDR